MLGNHQRRIPLETVARDLVAILFGTNGAGLAGLQIPALDVPVLRFRVDDIGILRIDTGVETVAAAYGNPIVIGDAFLLHRGAGAAPTVVILQASADVIRLLVIEGDLIELAHGDVVDVFPCATGIPRDVDSAIAAGQQVIGIRGVDPDGVEIGMDTRPGPRFMVTKVLPPSSDMHSGTPPSQTLFSLFGSTRSWL